MKRYLNPLVLLGLGLFASAAMAADYGYEIKQAQRSCDIQRRSLNYDRYGAPACDKVEQLIRLQRLEVEAAVARQTGQPMPSHTDVNINQDRGQKVWSNRLGRYCYENRWGHMDCSQ